MRNVVRRVRSWRPARNADTPRRCLGGICEQSAVCRIAGGMVRSDQSAGLPGRSICIRITSERRG